VAAAVYATAAVLLTWPLATVATTHLGAPEGPGDPYLNLWILGWGMRAWLADPAGTLAGRAFDAPIFHPAGLTLTYSDHQLLQALLAAPLYAWTGNLVLVYNVVLLGSIAASGLAMHALARQVTGSTAGAFVAGLAWACWPYRTAHLIHLQLQALYFLPLVVWALARVAASRRWRDAVLLGAAAALQAVASVYYGVMTAVVLACAAPVLAWTTGQWRKTRYWSRVLGAAGLAGLLVGPVAAPYLESRAIEGFGRNAYEAAHHAASLQSYTQVPPSNWLYGRSGLLLPRPPGPGERDRQHVEHHIFPGIVLTLLTLAGLWVGWRSESRPVVVTAATLVGTGVWLSLGPEGPLGIYAWLVSHAPGFDAIRAPARFAVVAALGGGLLAAVAVARTTVLRRGPLAVCAAALLLAEYVNVPFTFEPGPATTSAVGRWLRDAPEPGAVVYLPLGFDRENTGPMVAALEHGRPIVNGYSGQRPAFFTAVVEALATMPGPEALRMLQELDVRFVVSPAPLRGPVSGPSPLVERAALPEGHISELRWTPESEAALVAAPPPAPPAGPATFRDGERAVYEVIWVGGPLDVPAGTAILQAATNGTGWTFEASAETARWVARVFDARYRLVTAADGLLLPVRHQRDTREGRRHVTRTYDYDRSTREVRPGDASSGPPTPLSPEARDALSALYYIRTLALAPGDRIAVPLNDTGRSLTLDVRVVDRERIEMRTGARQALRLTPTITRRLERRAPVRATVWLSEDAVRIPLVVDVEAGFGRVRAELVDYRP
jgi:hypothetical protein